VFSSALAVCAASNRLGALPPSNPRLLCAFRRCIEGRPDAWSPSSCLVPCALLCCKCLLLLRHQPSAGLLPFGLLRPLSPYSFARSLSLISSISLDAVRAHPESCRFGMCGCCRSILTGRSTAKKYTTTYATPTPNAYAYALTPDACTPPIRLFAYSPVKKLSWLAEIAQPARRRPGMRRAAFTRACEFQKTEGSE